MPWAVRTFALAAGAAALVSTQAVHAAPVATAPAVDPLVTLSLFATAQSRAAVCGLGATCAAVIPAGTAVAGASPAVSASAAATAQDSRRDPRGKQLPMLALILGFMIAVAIAAALLAGDDDPVSPD
jgi:hypothetical protein